MTRPAPYDAEAEAALIGFLVGPSNWSEAEAIAGALLAEDFYDTRWCRAFAVWQPGISAHDLADRSGVPAPDIVAAVADGLNLSLTGARSTAQLIARLAFRRRAMAEGQSIATAAREGDLDELQRLIDRLPALAEPSQAAVPSITAPEFVDANDDPYDWVIPHVLEAKDRLLVTASEGAGKSMLLTQIACQVAAGVHAWTLRHTEPQPVLLIDLENAERLLRRRLRDVTRRVRCDLSLLRVECHPAGLDLTTRAGQMWLAGKVKANQPRLLVIGPLYRMYAGSAARGDTGGEDQARTVVKALDRIRESFGCALLMETHAPHGGLGGRDLRPFGSSVWLRWPEFGLGLSQDPDSDRRWVLRHWRGPRDARSWPTHLERSTNGWPWIAVGADGFVEEGAA